MAKKAFIHLTYKVKNRKNCKEVLKNHTSGFSEVFWGNIAYHVVIINL